MKQINSSKATIDEGIGESDGNLNEGVLSTKRARVMKVTARTRIMRLQFLRSLFLPTKAFLTWPKITFLIWASLTSIPPLLLSMTLRSIGLQHFNSPMIQLYSYLRIIIILPNLKVMKFPLTNSFSLSVQDFLGNHTLLSSFKPLASHLLVGIIQS